MNPERPPLPRRPPGGPPADLPCECHIGKNSLGLPRGQFRHFTARAVDISRMVLEAVFIQKIYLARFTLMCLFIWFELQDF